jgi:hypothetical protein
MDRKTLANKLFLFLKHNTQRKEKDIWKAIAETDDISLLGEYEKNIDAIAEQDQLEGQLSIFDYDVQNGI